MTKSITKHDVERLAARYQEAMQSMGENNMETQRREVAYREARAAYNASHKIKL
jgi:phage-related tail protein